MRILLVEDDEMIAESLEKALKQSGYIIDWCDDGEQALLSLETSNYDLILLDLGLPDMSGIEVLQKLRSKKDLCPVLVITAKDSVKDRVTGLDSGADDYLVKPFELTELEARIRALLRRKTGRSELKLVSGEIQLDPLTKECNYKEKSEILSITEYRLLAALMEHPGAFLTVSELEDKMYGWNEEVESNCVEAHIYQIRKKFDRSIIINRRGVGYRV